MTALFPTRAFRRSRERASGLLFAFGIDDLQSGVTASGHALTFTRASGRTVFDTQGRVATVAHSQFPWSGAYNATAAVYEPTCDIEKGRTNLCLQSENFGTTWSAIGTPTRVAAALNCGDLALDLIGDDASGALEGYSQVVTFTGSAVKAISVFVAPGTSTSSVLRLRDTTASADRLLARIQWSAGIPSITMTTGTFITAVRCYGGVYRLCFQTTSVTPGNVNQVELYPATTAALSTTNVGTLYAGGIQAENFEYPRSYLKTKASTQAASADSLTATVGFAPQDLTFYLRFATPVWLNILTSLPVPPGLFFRGDGTGNGAIYAQFNAGSPSTVGVVITDSTGSAATAGQTLPDVSVQDIAIQCKDFATQPACRVDCGAGFGSWSVQVILPVAAFSSDTLSLGRVSPTADATELNAGLRKVLIAPGLRTIAELRGAPI
jgi:hypothetical protein